MSVAEVVIKQEADVGACDDTQPMAIPNPVLPTTTHTATHTKGVQFLAKLKPLQPQDEGPDRLQISPKTVGSESFLIYELEKTGVDTTKFTSLQMLQNAHLSLQNAHLALENAHRKITKALPAESQTRTATTTATPTQTKTQITSNPSIINVEVCRNRTLDETTTHSSIAEKNRRLEMAPIFSTETSTKSNMMPIVPAITTASLSSSSLAPPPTQPSPAQPLAKATTTELKVKCLCQLEKSIAITPAKTQHLKTFFEQMFDETRQMSRRRQREVKMSLLQAVSMAEEQHDAGQNCAKCCI